jgi:hypothetical protein
MARTKAPEPSESAVTAYRDANKRKHIPPARSVGLESDLCHAGKDNRYNADSARPG